MKYFNKINKNRKKLKRLKNKQTMPRVLPYNQLACELKYDLSESQKARNYHRIIAKEERK